MAIKQLDEPAEIPQLLKNKCITNLMYLIWSSRKDLQHAFDLNKTEGQQGFYQWYEVSVLRENSITPDLAQTPSEDEDTMPSKTPLHSRLMRMESLLWRIGHHLPTPLRKIGKAIWFRTLAMTARRMSQNNKMKHEKSNFAESNSKDLNTLPGANLIGYAHAELGMGEHVRMSAAALSTTDTQFGVLNFNIGVSSRQQASLDHGQLIKRNIYRTNIFHINADQMLKAYCHLGRNFFANHYNIGYWFWELAKWPEEWTPVIGMVDEIWAPSRFIQEAVTEKTDIPIEYMPLCVTLPTFQKRQKAYFGLPENRFLYLFAFDFLSYFDRKNPFSTIQAFQSAFQDRSAPVGLVIKVMNGDAKKGQYAKMMEIIADDPRIHLINQTMSRDDVLALLDVCDCFVSLHRSEGFGLGPAEAMYLGKPVIVTNYSGNTDFTRPGNSCLVDYRLIPVQPGEYVFGEGQVWADADVEHAAWYMKRLVNDAAFAAEIGNSGQEYIHKNFDPVTIGALYAKRLEVINASESHPVSNL